MKNARLKHKTFFVSNNTPLFLNQQYYVIIGIGN